ncbi:hypothetical protein ACT3T7_08550 [Halomonas sp. 111]
MIAGFTFSHQPFTQEVKKHTVSRMTKMNVTCDVLVADGANGTCLILEFRKPGGETETYQLSDRQVTLLYRQTHESMGVGLVVPHLASRALIWRENDVLYQDRAA